jgi:hypothetical protein
MMSLRSQLLAGTPRAGQAIEAFWLEDRHRKAESWTAHCDINMVMLATSLTPESYLSI